MSATFDTKKRNFYETLSTVTMEFWLLHDLDVKIGGQGTCKDKFVEVNFYRMEEDTMKERLWIATIQVLKELELNSVTVQNEGKLFRVTATKVEPQWWCKLPNRIV